MALVAVGGLAPMALEVADKVKEQTGVEIMIYFTLKEAHLLKDYQYEGLRLFSGVPVQIGREDQH